MSEKKFLFEDIFEVQSVDKDGNHFDKVSRLECRGENYETDLVLDINCAIYSLKVNQRFTLSLASSVDNGLDQGYYVPNAGPSLLDSYDYCMCGKVFRTQADKNSKFAVYVSFGGLLMKLTGEKRHLTEIVLDNDIFLLIRKI